MIPTQDHLKPVQAIFNDLPLPVLLVEKMGKILYASPAAGELLNQTDKQLRGQTWIGIDAHLNLINWTKKLDQLRQANSKVLEYETDILTDDRYFLPVKVKLSAYSEQAVFVILETTLHHTIQMHKLKQLCDRFTAAHWHYLPMNGQWFCSTNSREILPFQDIKSLVFNDQKFFELLRKHFTEDSVKGFSEKIRNGIQTGRPASHTFQLIDQAEEYTFQMDSIRNLFQTIVISGLLTPKAAHSTLRTVSNPSKDETYENQRDELIQFTIDNAHELILWVGPEGLVRYVNQRFLERTGYQRQEVEGQSILTLFPSSDDTFRKTIWGQLREEKKISLEVSLKLKTQETIPVHASLNYVVHKGKEYDCVYLRDWTRKKERDMQLQLTKTALEAAREFVVWLDQGLRIIFLNKAALKLAGGSTANWMGRKVRKLLPGIKKKWILAEETLETAVPSAQGGTAYLELNFSQLEENDVIFYMIIGRNVTERVMRRRELEKAFQQIEELSNQLQEENLILKEEVRGDQNLTNIITVSPKYQYILEQVSQVAETDTTVLLLGETGTGKELLARAVHTLSEREDHPLIKVNCAAIPPNLIESELFGYEKGAFTGAQNRKKGRFEAAHRGTLFLDEIGELPLNLQSKLLSVLQEGTFERVGGNETIEVDVRVIAATNRKLEEMVSNNTFRADLYYRLNVFPIVNIPLRERPEDIPVLAEYFAKRFAQQQGKKIKKLNSADLKRLEKYRFPGNVRELENIVERAVVLCKSSTLSIPLDQRSEAPKLNDNIFLTFEEMQRQYLIEALKKTGGRITGPEGAGRLLGLNDRTLMSKIRKFDIQKKEYLL